MMEGQLWTTVLKFIFSRAQGSFWRHYPTIWPCFRIKFDDIFVRNALLGSQGPRTNPPMLFLWSSNVFSYICCMIFLWFPCAVPMFVWCFCCGVPLLFSCFSCRFPMLFSVLFSWCSYGFLMLFLCFPWVCPIVCSYIFLMFFSACHMLLLYFSCGFLMLNAYIPPQPRASRYSGAP